MKETKQNHDSKDNTGMVIAMIISALLVIGLIAYFVMNGNNDVKDAIDNGADTIENATDNNQKTAADVAGSYQASINNDNGEDVAEDTEDFIELVLKEDGTAKLYISDKSQKTINGAFTIDKNRLVITGGDTNTTNDNNDSANTTNDNNDSANTANDNTTTDDTDTDNEVMASNNTYEFTINDDDTLTYQAENSVTLAKVDHDSLRYIK